MYFRVSRHIDSLGCDQVFVVTFWGKKETGHRFSSRQGKQMLVTTMKGRIGIRIKHLG